MKKIAQINSVCTGSTGKIMGDIQRHANNKGYETISFFGRGEGFSDVQNIKFNNDISCYINMVHTMVFNKQGMQSKKETERLIKKLEEFDPDVLHLHNIHGYYLNYQMLFEWINNKYNGKVVWTLHDCWTFTGHCAYFSFVNCNKWKKNCDKKCPMRHGYPYSFFVDTSNTEFLLKKKLFTKRKDFEIITPSYWLEGLVKQSILKEHSVKTIHNGINLNIFKENNDSNVKNKYNIPAEKKIVLGVANIWEKRKGFDEFINLADILGEKYVVVLVGLSKIKINKIKKYSNIVGIGRTETVDELVSLYSISDVFVNLTKEDNYPTVNMEAIACGTPVITYNTGGCIEQVNDKVGYCCRKNEISEVKNKVEEYIECDFKRTIFDNREYMSMVDANIAFEEYIKVYERLLNDE